MGFQSIVRRMRRWCLQRRLFITSLCLVIVLHLTLESATAAEGTQPSPLSPSPPVPSVSPAPTDLSAPEEADLLPQPQVHPLPPSLAQWQVDAVGDYFSEVQPTNLGYLVWSEFPVRVYLDPGFNPAQAEPASDPLVDAWLEAVEGAIAEWNVYLPIEVTESADQADITILRRTPPLVIQPGQPLQARSAETRYEFYADTQHQPPVLRHRFQIFLRSDQSATYVQAAARHELGHALGIWGHSSINTDALYFSQVRSPAPISPRDINTLQKIYQQPTRLGWALSTPVMP